MADDTTPPQTEETPTQTTEPVTPTETPPQEQPIPQENSKPEENIQTPTSENTQPITEPQPTQIPEAPTQPTNPPVKNPSSETVATTQIPEQKPEEQQTPTQQPETTSPAPSVSIPQLHYPFSGNFSVTFSFGAQSDNEEIKKKYTEWGITGHNGLDFGLTDGTEVYPCDNGKVIQSGENGDFGNSITLEHSWGISLYAHLKETKINVGETAEINKVIGISGKTGAAFGEHLHFAIKPLNPDNNNSYLGFIDPTHYLSLPSQKEEVKQETETPPIEEQKSPERSSQETKPPEAFQSQQEQPKPEEAQSQISEVPPSINYGSEKPAEPEPQPQQTENPKPPKPPQNSQPTEVSPEVIQKQVEDPELNRRVDEKLKTELDLRRQKANEARQTKREENLMKIEKLIEEKKQINNDNVRELLHVSQSTATDYLQTLVDRGTIKTEGKGKATVYHY